MIGNSLLDKSLNYFLRTALILSGLYWLGRRNALNIKLVKFDLHLEKLPQEFEGYRILHISDPHFDTLPQISDRIIDHVSGLQADLCVFTGDYRDSLTAPAKPIMDALGKVIEYIDAKDGIFATLGNHDSWKMVAPMEELGITVLNNEISSVRRGNATIKFFGIDDVHYFYSKMAYNLLRTAEKNFSIALVHSPEWADIAADAGHDLYLAGHTHGGQVALPNGRPVLTRLRRNRHLYRGAWKLGGMHGYTSCGAGVGNPPVRFNTRGEVTRITLRAAPQTKVGAQRYGSRTDL